MKKKTSTSFVQHWSDSTRFVVVGFFIISVLGFGYLVFQSNQLDQAAPNQPTTAESTATPIVDTNTPTVFPTSSILPTITPLATKKLVQPTPTPVTGVDMRFHELHFYRHPDPMVGYTPFRVANGGSITVPNEKNVSEFELFAWFVNQGSEESKSKNIWVRYFVDSVEVKNSLVNLPDNMVADELMVRGAAQPVQIPASGTHTVKIVIDPENQSNDVNQTNNTYTFTYTVK